MTITRDPEHLFLDGLPWVQDLPLTAPIKMADEADHGRFCESKSVHFEYLPTWLIRRQL